MSPDQYTAEVRKWPRRPSDYDERTEAIIRRILSPSTSLADIGAEIQRGQVAFAEKQNQDTSAPAPDSPLPQAAE